MRCPITIQSVAGGSPGCVCELYLNEDDSRARCLHSLRNMKLRTTRVGGTLQGGGIITVFLLVMFISACSPAKQNTAQPQDASPQQQGTPPSSPPPVNPEPSQPPPPAQPDKAVDMPLTLPVLDAFFSDDTFASELKSKLHLTDGQVSKLRTTARQETASLRETADDRDSNESTEQARLRASQKISAIIDEQKTQQLAGLIRERWSDGAKIEVNTTANAVPTDTRIVVNAPAYRMDLYNNGQLIKTYRVSIGYPEFPLPTGLRLASSIIFNPTWTPPDEPWVETSHKVKVGEKIPAGDKLNPLGPIKIPIGLPSLIHGGKPVSKIGALGSHGCVGLTSPQVNDFAQLLAQLGNTELSETQVIDYEKNPSATRKINLSTPVPVELRYETIVVEDGKLHIYRDVYDRNTNTEDNLRNVLKIYGVTPEQLSPDERAKITDALREMSRDANGKLDDQSSKPSVSTDKKKNPTGKVTPGFKGRKEVVIEVAALAQKGYPAPVNFSTGVENKRQTASARRKTGKR